MVAAKNTLNTRNYRSNVIYADALRNFLPVSPKL